MIKKELRFFLQRTGSLVKYCQWCKKNTIGQLLQSGYYIIKKHYISDKKFAKLIGKVNKSTRIETWMGLIVI